MQIERLVTMANQIAAFFGSEPDFDEAVTLTAGHLKRYWDPRMRREIVAHVQSGGDGLSEIARAAVATLASPPVPPPAQSASTAR